MARMVPVVLKNLFSGPATRRYPFETRAPFPGARGRLTWNAAACDFCGDCQRLCPAACLEVRRETKEIVHDPFHCIYCHLCAEGCWQGAITVENVYFKPDYCKAAHTYTPAIQP